jgi:hypothetical protein
VFFFKSYRLQKKNPRELWNLDIWFLDGTGHFQIFRKANWNISNMKINFRYDNKVIQYLFFNSDSDSPGKILCVRNSKCRCVRFFIRWDHVSKEESHEKLIFNLKTRSVNYSVGSWRPLEIHYLIRFRLDIHSISYFDPSLKRQLVSLPEISNTFALGFPNDVLLIMLLWRLNEVKKWRTYIE